MLHRPGDAYSVDLFWRGEQREFSGWYVNLQAPIRGHGAGFDTLDHELDYGVDPDGTWTEKDSELFEQRVREGRYGDEVAASVRSVGAAVREMLTCGEQWWDPRWADWQAPRAWSATTLLPEWDVVTADRDGAPPE